MKIPCKNCTDRSPVCHANCFAWKVYRAGEDKKYKESLESRIEANAFYGYLHDRCTRNERIIRNGKSFRFKKNRRK